MRVPHVISKNAIKAYEVPPVFILNEKIRSDDFTWVEGPIERLRILCLLAIAKYWESKYIQLDINTNSVAYSTLPCKYT